MSTPTRILLIEDSSADAELVEREVRRTLPHSEYMCVETEQDFIAALSSFTPDIILSDYTLPQFSGMAALELAKANVPEIPFILVTGSVNEETAVNCMKAGAWDYLIKEHITRIGPGILNAMEQKRLRDEARSSERELRASEERLRTTLDSIGDAVISTDAHGRIELMNPVAEQLTGWSFVEASGKSMREVFITFNPNTGAPIPNPVDLVLKYGKIVDPIQHTLLLSKEGKKVPICNSGAPILNSTGEISGVVLVFRDQTAELEIHRSLEENEARFRNLLQSMEIIPVQGYNEAREVIYWNNASERVYGYSEAEAMGQKLEDLIIPPQMHEEVIQQSKKWYAQNVTIPTTELVLQNKAGQPVQVFSSHVMHVTSSGKKELFCIDVDLRELKAAENKMRTSQQITKRIINSIPVRVFWKDTHRVYLGCNEAFARDAGFSDPKEIIGKNDIQMAWEKQTEQYHTYDRRVIAGESILDKEVTIITPDGKKLTHLMSKVPLRNTQGEIFGILGSYVDITEQRQLENQLQQAQKMESIGRLAGGVAHDFNNLLMGIMGYTDICKDQAGEDSDLIEYLDAITEVAQRSAAITRQLLTFARKQIVQPKELDLNESIEGMLKLLRRLLGEDVEIMWSPGPGQMTIKMDPSQIDQILANLAVNARDAIQGVGSLIIKTEAVIIDEKYCAKHEGTLPGNYVKLKVTDSGCGMDKETIANIFEPFYTTKNVGQGTGLGLSTVYGIVKQNNGFINVDSAQGKGASFNIFIPRIKTDVRALKPKTLSKTLPQGTETILIAEDEKSILITNKYCLESLGYTVLAAESPEHALDLVANYTGKVHLLLTDVVMPGMNGPDLAKKLTEKYPDLKCLFMSGFTADIITRRGISEKNMHFMSKPFGSEELSNKVRKILDEKS
ncbi:PAS domain S-box protein [Kiritimatiellota bacterium B12222]|nr:PAS domain S-box protein [Kiritimatiellota bacterium B12222]